MKPLARIKSIKRPSFERPSWIKRPSFSIPSPWLIGGVLLAALWIGWAVYIAADRGSDAGLGVLVAWPALLLLAALVTAPIAAIVYFVVKLIRAQRREGLTETGGDADEESITDRTSP